MDRTDRKAAVDGWAGSVDAGHAHAMPDGAGGLTIHALSGEHAFRGTIPADPPGGRAKPPFPRAMRVAQRRTGTADERALRALSSKKAGRRLTPSADGGAILIATHPWGEELRGSRDPPAPRIRTLEVALERGDGREAMGKLFESVRRNRERRERARVAVERARRARDEVAAAQEVLPDARGMSERRAEKLVGALNEFKRAVAARE